ncbi:MAG: hypothetical protein VKK04_25570 [Synechococcales bacterium]|nr:hypothetical protein [Synechococcales bacterium]
MKYLVTIALWLAFAPVALIGVSGCTEEVAGNAAEESPKTETTPPTTEQPQQTIPVMRGYGQDRGMYTEFVVQQIQVYDDKVLAPVSIYNGPESWEPIEPFTVFLAADSLGLQLENMNEVQQEIPPGESLELTLEYQREDIEISSETEWIAMLRFDYRGQTMEIPLTSNPGD